MRGRWVGERTENGKRVRMRSTDYDKVLEWVQGTSKEQHKGTPLRGLPQYSVDVERRKVYNKWGKTLKGDVRSNRVIYKINHEGMYHTLSWERIAYAALHDIEVLKIPTDLFVTEVDGQYLLQHAGDFYVEHNRRVSHCKMQKITGTISKRIRELEMLQRFYQTHDAQEIVTYATKDIFEGLVLHVVSRNHCAMQRATDIVTEATEHFLHRITSGTLPTVRISANIRSLCQKITKQETRKREYNEQFLNS